MICEKIFIAVLGILLLGVMSVWAEEIHVAVIEGEIAKVESLLAEKPKLINAEDKNGFTPMHFAAGQGHKDVAELLIAKGADVNAKSKEGYTTPLHFAALKGSKEVAELLIAKGADVNAKSKKGYTALHFAAGKGQTEVAELLIAKGADVNAKSETDETPLHYAAYWGQTEAAELLRKHKAKATVSKVVPVEYLTEIIFYDKYQRPASCILRDIEGKVIAKKAFEFNQFNPTQKIREITREWKWDSSSNKILRETNYEGGESKAATFLVLDEKGNIITKDDKAVLVNYFQAEQKAITDIKYRGAYKSNKITKIYPCKNCAEKTGIKNCSYVW
jgi:hypothetical protein